VLAVGLGATAILFVMGVTLGATAGVAGGVVDALIARAVEALTAIPSLVLALVVESLVLHPTSATLFWTLALTRWTAVARVVRAETISTSRMGYVVAARALGASPARILLMHVLPNVIGSALPAAVLGVASFVSIEASVDFLLGLRAASEAWPSWAEMMAQARNHPGAWWLVGLPAMGLCTILVAFHLVGEAVRCALDPTLGAGCGRSGDTRVLSTSELTRSRGSRHMAL
jgi:ABC-type dipeptide/oligopeptide/nickel transport system permease subunit